MAGSRLERIGTIFSRATGLLRTGAVKYEDRPIWFDVYRVFPPKYEPHFDRQPIIDERTPEEVPNLLYNEDIPRAAFYKRFGNNPGGTTRNLSNLGQDDLSQRFIERYNEVQAQHGDWNSDKIVESISPEFSFQRFGSDSSFTGTSSSSLQSGTPSVSETLIREAFDETDSENAVVNRGRRKNIIRADALLSMFKEAQEKVGTKNKDGTESDKS